MLFPTLLRRQSLHQPVRRMAPNHSLRPAPQEQVPQKYGCHPERSLARTCAKRSRRTCGCLFYACHPERGAKRRVEGPRYIRGHPNRPPLSPNTTLPLPSPLLLSFAGNSGLQPRENGPHKQRASAPGFFPAPSTPQIVQGGNPVHPSSTDNLQPATCNCIKKVPGDLLRP